MKRGLIISIAFFFISISSYGQGLKTKMSTLEDGSKFCYTVFSNNKKIKDGIATIQNKENKIWMRGKFKNNVRKGDLFFFNSDITLFLRYNYDQNIIVHIDTSSLNIFSLELPRIDSNKVNDATMSIPLSSIDHLLSLLTNKFQLGEKMKGIQNNYPIEFTAQVDKNGNASYSASYYFYDSYYTGILKIKDKSFIIKWIPAYLNNNPVNSKIKINAIVSTFRNKENKKQVVWKY